MNKLTNSEVNHIITDDGIEYLKFKKLDQYSDKIDCIMTLKCESNSIDQFSLSGAGDSEKEIKSRLRINYNIALDIMNVKDKKVIALRQTRKDGIVKLDKNIEVNEVYQPNIEADAAITNDRNIVIKIGIADCIPIVIYDEINNAFGLIHSGWEGTSMHIVAKTAKKMNEEYGSKLENMICVLGAGIGKCCFEVDTDVYNIFKNEYSNESEYITYNSDKNKYYIDLLYCIKQDMLELGIKEENISTSNICTVCNKDKFFSYRGNKDKGRMAVLVSLK